MRFFCTGRVVEWDQPEFEPLLKRMGKPRVAGARAVILLDVFKVASNQSQADDWDGYTDPYDRFKHRAAMASRTLPPRRQQNTTTRPKG